jgi:hypothetical protein
MTHHTCPSILYNKAENVHTMLYWGMLLYPWLLWKCNHTFPSYSCWCNCSCQQYTRFSAAMEIQQWVPFAMLSSYRIFHTAVNNNNYLILWVCVHILTWISSMQITCTVLYFYLWPVWLYHIFLHYLTNSTIQNYWTDMFFAFSTILLEMYSTKNPAWFYHHCTYIFMQSSC